VSDSQFLYPPPPPCEQYALLNMRVPRVDGGAEYQTVSGTSLSAPVVAGAAVLLLAEYPNLTPWCVKEIMMATAWRKPELNGKSSSGILNIGGFYFAPTEQRLVAAVTEACGNAYRFQARRPA